MSKENPSNNSGSILHPSTKIIFSPKAKHPFTELMCSGRSLEEQKRIGFYNSSQTVENMLNVALKVEQNKKMKTLIQQLAL
jgi:hypothetical protein